MSKSVGITIQSVESQPLTQLIWCRILCNLWHIKFIHFIILRGNDTLIQFAQVVGGRDASNRDCLRVINKR